MINTIGPYEKKVEVKRKDIYTTSFIIIKNRFEPEKKFPLPEIKTYA